MAIADLAHPLEVAGRRREAPTGVLHGLEYDAGDGVRTLHLDGQLDLVGRPATERLEVVTVLRGSVEVRVRHLDRARDQWLEILLRVRNAGDRQRALRRAVVGDGAADHLVLHRFADELEVLLGQLPCRLHGLAAAGGEEDVVEVGGRVDRPAGPPVRWPAGGSRTRSGRTQVRMPACTPPRPIRGGRGRLAPRTARRGRRGSCGRSRRRCGRLHRARSSAPGRPRRTRAG